MLIAWASIFYDKNNAIILNMNKKAGVENLRKITAVLEALPTWMIRNKTPYIKGGKLINELRLINGSMISVMYPATIHDPSTVARSLTSPILYIDEAAFIPHMDEIYGSAQQTLATATSQAIKNGFPYFILITSTPNGKVGDGEWFYKRWNNAYESDELFSYNEERQLDYWNENYWDDEYWSKLKETNEENSNINSLSDLVTSNGHNGYIKVKYHWSESSFRDDNWYRVQCAEIDNPRTINQEIDLLFVGGKNTILSDDAIQSFKPRKAIEQLALPSYANLRIYNEPDPLDYYIIGVDTAWGTSEKSAYNAIQVVKFSNLEQIAELHYKHGSFKRYSDDIIAVFEWLYKRVGHRIIFGVERNTIGLAIIENLINYEHINFIPYLYYEKDKPGILTTGVSKAYMVKLIIDYITANPQVIYSNDLINQISSIETGGSEKTIKSPIFTDLFMALCFTAYVREKKWIELAPLIQQSEDKLTNDMSYNMAEMISLNSPKNFIRTPERVKEYAENLLHEIKNPPIQDPNAPLRIDNSQVLRDVFSMNFEGGTNSLEAEMTNNDFFGFYNYDESGIDNL